MTSNTPKADAADVLLEFLYAFMRRDYAAALEHTQISWRALMVDAKESLRRALIGIMPEDLVITDVACEKEGDTTGVVEVFSDCMLDFPYSVTGRSDDMIIEVTGTARLICELGYMQPDEGGTWGVNPVSLTRIEATSTPVD